MDMFYIPTTVRFDERLTKGARLLYGEIVDESRNNGYCERTNKDLACMYDVSNRTIRHWIKELKDKGIVRTEIIYFGNTKQIESRRIYPLVDSFGYAFQRRN